MKENTPLLIFLRYLDMFVVHTVSTYIFYYSLYLNLYAFISTSCLSGLVILYYLYNNKFYHSYIHILGSTAILSAIKSCQCNLDSCHMC